MGFDPEKHHRRSIRLKGYDYGQAGAYYVTICTHERRMLFGAINNGEMHLNDPGQVAQWIWNALPEYFPTIELDQFVVMPNHLHGILINRGTGKHAIPLSLLPMPMSSPNPLLGQIIRRFKALTSYYIHAAGVAEFAWQERFHDHVVQNIFELQRIREYIINNPARWAEDDLYSS